MRKLSLIPALLVLLALTVLLALPVYASSSQAYQDYLFQFDQYRSAFTNFQVAKNEYIKFKSLSAETASQEKTKQMLTKRDMLLTSYVQLLNEKLTEDQGLSSGKQQYQTLIKNEVAFLGTHMTHIATAVSLEDMTRISEELETHYNGLQIVIRQVLTGLSLGQLTILSQNYDKTLRDAQAIVTANSPTLPTGKQETINRWILQIRNKRSSFQQKYDAIQQKNTQLAAADIRELDNTYSELVKEIKEARQYLQEGASFFVELTSSLKYID